MENHGKQNIVDRAERIMLDLMEEENRNKKISTSQIRNILSSVNTVNSKVQVSRLNSLTKDDVLSSVLVDQIKFLKAKFLYDAGKDDSGAVYNFMKKSNLAGHIDEIGNSYTRFQAFVKYVEALVAFHKYYGSRNYR